MIDQQFQGSKQYLRFEIIEGKFKYDMDEGGWFGVLRGKQDPYIKLEAFNQTMRTTTKNEAGRAATWNESFDFTYD